MNKINLPRLFVLLVISSLFANVVFVSPVLATHTNRASPPPAQAVNTAKPGTPAKTQVKKDANGLTHTGKWLYESSASIANRSVSFVTKMVNGLGSMVKAIAAKIGSTVQALTPKPAPKKIIARASLAPQALAQRVVDPTPRPKIQGVVLAETSDLTDLGERVAVLETNFSTFTAPSLSTLNATSANLIRNSSFEAESGSKPRQWNYQLDSTTGTTFRSNEAVHSGSYSLKFKGGSTGNLGISQPDVKTIPGRTYTFSGTHLITPWNL